MFSPKVFNLLKVLYAKGEIRRCEQECITTKWYFDYVIMKLEKAKIIRQDRDKIYMTVIGRRWAEKLFLMSDEHE